MTRRFVDYYDLLSLGPEAPMELIEASVRLRLHRYAPDNKETSDP